MYKMQSEGRSKRTGFAGQPIAPLCHGCLSSDRELSSIGDFENIFRIVCDIKTPVTGVSTDIYLCWECSAILKRFQTFHKQVKSAQSLLKSLYYDYKNKESQPKSLSRLKVTKTNHDFITLTEPEPDIKPLEKIKQEVDQAEDYEATDFIDDNDFAYLEDIKSEDPTFIIKLQKIKKEKSALQYKKKKINYYYIRSPEKMIEPEEARQTYFSELWERERHIAARSGTNCKMCMKKFSESESVETHNRNYHNECIGPHVCSICRTRYPTPDELASHITLHNTIYCCIVCCHRTLNMEDAVGHASGHKKVVKCKLCRYYCLKVKPDYFVHYKSMHTEFVCDHCGKRCKMKRVLRQHITRSHMESKCDTCGGVFRNYNRLQGHIASVHAMDRTEASFCVKCNVQFQNRVRYQRHLSTSAAHRHEKQSSKTKEPIKCLVCDNRYSRRTYMMNHYRYVHMAKSNYYCQECDKYFLNRTRYVHHRQQIHDGAEKKRDKLCSVCGRGFTTNRILTHHMRTHTGERPFECAQCGARFAQRTARDTHQRKHNRKKDIE